MAVTEVRIHETRDKLQWHIDRLAARTAELAEKERRARALADLQRTEHTELDTLIKFQGLYGETLRRLAALDWPQIGREINVGEAPAEMAAIIHELSDAIRTHREVLAAFAVEGAEGGGGADDALLKRAIELQGLAGRLHARIEGLVEMVEKL